VAYNYSSGAEMEGNINVVNTLPNEYITLTNTTTQYTFTE